MQKTDVFIIGGGPAGVAAAIAARQLGFSVLVADGTKPPIDKPCGEGLLPDSIAALKKIGVDIRVNDGFPLRSIKFIDPSNSVSATFPNAGGIGLRRTILHQRMTDRAAELGVGFLWNTPVTGLNSNSAKLANGHSISARWIIGADGGQSRVRRWAGLDTRHRAQARVARRAHFAIAPWSEGVEVHWSDRAQAYITPVSPAEICVVVVSAKTDHRLTMDLAEFPQLACRLKNAHVSRPERGAITAMRRLERVHKNNVALLGDASGAVDAITGEGLSLAFHQAAALAQAMAENNLAKYQQAHRRIVRRPTFIARLLLLLNAHPRVRQKTLHTFAKHPEVFARLVAFHIGESSVVHLAATGAMLGWRFLEA